MLISHLLFRFGRHAAVRSGGVKHFQVCADIHAGTYLAR